MRVVLVGPVQDRQRLRQAMPAGAFDVIGEFESLGEARRHAANADAIVLTTANVRATSQSTPEPLTAREIDVLELMAEGLPNKAIASRLGISDQTVKFHVSSICGKLGARNRTGAVRMALTTGLIAI